ncbi:phosphotransferase enzyme family protein [Halomonas sp. KM-1]|uniref:phosphotransferase enzyme family protein n=1 Tax=Halomonas sp. KM-1 TaxID=590061 RepID=UPI000474EF41|nr:phosphotransferase [Halomonas sp. KM-1]
MSNDDRRLPQWQTSQLRGLAAEALSYWAFPYRELSLIKYRENAVFKVVAEDGQSFALRLHRPGYHDDAALNSELQWLEALARAGVKVPQVIATPDGRRLVLVGEGKAACRADLIAWVDGIPMEELDSAEEVDLTRLLAVYRRVGRAAAQLHNHATSWPLPEDFRRHAWDLDGLVGESPFWGRFWELPSLTGEQRALLHETRAWLQRELAAYGQSHERYGLIHADLVVENVLVDDERVHLIDFDDAGFGWYLFELATVLYHIQDRPYFEAAREALIDGYRELRGLPDDELARLPLFLVARGVTYLGWVQERQETATAQELTPYLIQQACQTIRCYLANRE